MKATTVAVLTAIFSILATSAGAYVVRAWEQDASAMEKIIRLETIAESNALAVTGLIAHQDVLTKQVQDLAQVCARLTALVEGSRGR
jgi:uncharacterized membrane protein